VIRILSAFTAKALQAEVNALLAEGWEIVGWPHIVDGDEGRVWYATLWRDQ